MIRKYFLDDTFLRKSFSVCFLFFTLCLLSTLDTVLASDDEDDTENITKGVAALASKKYVLERYDGDLQAQYTDEITLSSGKAFSLIRPGAVAKTQAVTTLTPVPRSHLLAQGICYHSEELYTADIETSLGFPEILAVPDSVIDWVSYSASAAPVNAGYYSRVTAATVHGGHSEAQFIADMDALWVHDYTAILKLLLPSTVFHGDQDVYMTGIELFGSFDMCSRHTGSGVNRYDCIGKLAEFRENHKTGQKSISKAIRNLLKDRFKGQASEGFVLTYHTTAPYTASADYYATDSDDEESKFLLRWGDTKFKLSGTSHVFSEADTLSQSKTTENKQKVLYAHIHNLTGKKLTYHSDKSFSDIPKPAAPVSKTEKSTASAKTAGKSSSAAASDSEDSEEETTPKETKLSKKKKEKK